MVLVTKDPLAVKPVKILGLSAQELYEVWVVAQDRQTAAAVAAVSSVTAAV